MTITLTACAIFAYQVGAFHDIRKYNHPLPRHIVLSTLNGDSELSEAANWSYNYPRLWDRFRVEKEADADCEEFRLRTDDSSVE